MKYAVFLPNFGPFGDVDALVELAVAAEARGWDAFYLWDHINWDGSDSGDAGPVVDPWISLTAIAAATETIRLGTMITPIARRRPWKLARETATLDRFSGGRLNLGVGLGTPTDLEFAAFGEETDDRTRAAILDEGLEVLDGLWSGERFSFSGEHFQIDGVNFDRPHQQPRVPIWCGGWWPNRRPFRRAARWDGVIPEKVGGDTLTPAEVAEIKEYVSEHRDGRGSFDIAIDGYSGAVDAESTIADYEVAGVTHWLERIEPHRLYSREEARELVDGGPPSPQTKAGGKPLDGVER